MVAQRSAGDGFGCGADVGWGWTRSQGRGGQGIDSVPKQMWVGADLVPVQMWVGMSTVRWCQSQMLMRPYRGEPYQAALRCAHTQHVHESCAPSRRKPTVRRATLVPQV